MKKEYACFLTELLNGKEYSRENYPTEFGDLIDGMMNEGMLYKYDKAVYQEPIKFYSNYAIRGFFDIPPQFENFYIEASDKCAYACDFCDMKKVIGGCNSCVKWNRAGKKASTEKLLETIQRLLNIHTHAISILGGDPLLNWDYVSNVISVVRGKYAEIPIYLYIANLDIAQEILDYLKANKVSLKIMVVREKLLVGGQDEGGVNKTYCNKIEHIRKEIIDSQIVPMGVFEDICRIKDVLQSITDSDIMVEAIDYVTLPKTVIPYEKRQQLPIDAMFSRKSINRCLNNKIALSLSGDVTVCPALDDVIVNVCEKEVDEAFFENGIYERWEMGKENIKDCGKCPMKWLCKDCFSALEMADEKGVGGSYFCGKRQEKNTVVK